MTIAHAVVSVGFICMVNYLGMHSLAFGISEFLCTLAIHFNCIFLRNEYNNDILSLLKSPILVMCKSLEEVFLLSSKERLSKEIE